MCYAEAVSKITAGVEYVHWRERAAAIQPALPEMPL